MRRKISATVLCIALSVLGCANLQAKTGDGAETSVEKEKQRFAKAQRAREAEVAADEAVYREKTEVLAARMGVAVPTWQSTWKVRFESLQYKERRLQEQREKDAAREADEAHERERKRRSDAWLEYRAERKRRVGRTSRLDDEKNREAIREKYVRLADLAAAGIQNDDRKLLKVQLLRLSREGFARARADRVPEYVVRGLDQYEWDRAEMKGEFAYPMLPTGRALAELVSKLEAEGRSAARASDSIWAKQAKDAISWLDKQLDDPPSWEKFTERYAAYAKTIE